jgi:pyridoxal phosphate enzyme (YggS family)
MEEIPQVLKERLGRLEERIDRAAARAGRRREDITLVAVTKTFPASAIREAYALGLRHFGENYVQEFEVKAPELSGLGEARFHFVGHLQSNKARRAAELFQVIETIDSSKLCFKINEVGATIEVMLEVKLSPEQAKSGVEPERLPSLVEAVHACPNLRLTGLMTMPPWSDDPEQSRPYFQRLRRLAKEQGLDGLSMGMSQDFEVAIEEGATHLRIGTALFGSRRRV